MCYYISITPKLTDFQVRFGSIFEQSESYQPVSSASAFSFQEIPIISKEDMDDIQDYRQGQIPFWVKDLALAKVIRQRTLNARAETIFEKPSFRHVIRSKQYLVLADGFFERWHEKRKAYPYYIRLGDHTPFSIAGI
jgi:putative SOS response-associated peptidase YedK